MAGGAAAALQIAVITETDLQAFRKPGSERYAEQQAVRGQIPAGRVEASAAARQGRRQILGPAVELVSPLGPQFRRQPPPGARLSRSPTRLSSESLFRMPTLRSALSAPFSRKLSSRR